MAQPTDLLEDAKLLLDAAESALSRKAYLSLLLLLNHEIGVRRHLCDIPDGRPDYAAGKTQGRKKTTGNFETRVQLERAVIRKYFEGVTLPKMAYGTGVSIDTVRTILREQGVLVQVRHRSFRP